MLIDTWGEVLTRSFQGLWFQVIQFIPNILIAIIIFAAGWVTGSVVGGWIASILRALKIDVALRKIGIEDATARAGYRLDIGVFFGVIVKWFIILAFFMASLEVLGLSQVNLFLQQVLAYLPNIIVTALILIVAAFVADFLGKLVSATARATGTHSSHAVATVVRWVVWIFAIIAALSQLGVAPVVFQTLLTGIVAMLALAGGLAFGLGGKEAASRTLTKVGEEMKRK